MKVGDVTMFTASAEGARRLTWSVWSRPVSHAAQWSYVPGPEDAGWQQISVEIVGDPAAAKFSAEYRKNGAVPSMLDADGAPMRRNFVHVDDLVEAISAAIDHPAARRQTFNICMDEPIDYGAVAAHLKKTRGLPSVAIETPYRSTWLDNAKAKFRLGWRPRYDLERLVDAAYDYKRAPDDPRKVWYPG